MKEITAEVRSFKPASNCGTTLSRRQTRALLWPRKPGQRRRGPGEWRPPAPPSAALRAPSPGARADEAETPPRWLQTPCLGSCSRCLRAAAATARAAAWSPTGSVGSSFSLPGRAGSHAASSNGARGNGFWQHQHLMGRLDAVSRQTVIKNWFKIQHVA